jgi:hypothetical protein
MKTLFGNVTETIELIERKQLDDGSTQTVSKAGKLTIITTSNEPSSEAIQRIGQVMNRIAEKHIDQKRQQGVA